MNQAQGRPCSILRRLSVVAVFFRSGRAPFRAPA